MAYNDRFQPVGTVWKYFNGSWQQPGLRGRTTPIFSVKSDWQREDTDAFWGPSIHWNTYLEKYVMLLNHSCCTSGWPQEGIYASFGDDLANVASWTQPVKILDDPGWYPQILGMSRGDTDSVSGPRARLYVYGRSSWEVFFFRRRPAETEPGLTSPERVISLEE